jgi:hypothetical protein
MKDIFFKRKQYKFSEWDSNLLPEAHKTRTLPNRLKKHDNVVSKTNKQTKVSILQYYSIPSRLKPYR